MADLVNTHSRSGVWSMVVAAWRSTGIWGYLPTRLFAVAVAGFGTYLYAHGIAPWGGIAVSLCTVLWLYEIARILTINEEYEVIRQEELSPLLYASEHPLVPSSTRQVIKDTVSYASQVWARLVTLVLLMLASTVGYNLG